jgi:hypothetical protein
VAARPGHAAGDQYVTLTLVAGEVDSQLEAALREWAGRHAGFNPRRGMTDED